MKTNYVFNKHPLKEEAFVKLPLSSILPKGWLYKQLSMQAGGLTGQLEELWEDVGANSGWLGGSGESWERGPYYLDGLLPLAYLLEDSNLIARSQKWIEWTLNNQSEDGNFGPRSNKDWWPRMVMLKVIIQYYGATEDERVISFMTKYFQYQSTFIKEQPLFNWAVPRGGENILCIYWLYNRTGASFLLDLAKTIHDQTTNWTELLSDFPYKDSTENYLDWDYVLSLGGAEKLAYPDGSVKKEEIDRMLDIYHETHVVNIAMGIKEPSVFYQQSGKSIHKDVAKKGIHQLMKFHGRVYGMFSGDEHLNGDNPTQGTELCAIVEYMFSLETLIGITGDSDYGDYLEKVAYNALPATLKSDFRAHQYLQQANQISCTINPRNWYNNNDDANIFGFEPHFPCCLANMHQGWPKFVDSMWMATKDNGLALIAYGPCEVSAKVGLGKKIKITEETEYPFENKVALSIECEASVRFPLMLRIPSWTEGAVVLVNDESITTSKDGFCTIDRIWENGDQVKIEFPMKIVTSRWFRNTIGIERGPLVYGLRIGESWRRLNGTKPAYDWEVYPTTPWNYGLMLNMQALEGSFKVLNNALQNQPFQPEQPPIELKIRAKKIIGWGIDNNSAGIPPVSPIESNLFDNGTGKNKEIDLTEEVTLIPYGCTNLRISQFPYIPL